MRRAVLCLLVVAAGCAGLGGAPSETVTVTEVVDGDTVEVEVGGDRETVRLLGVDTPERHVPTTPAEFGAPNTTAGRACLRTVARAASAYLGDLVAARPVELTFDDAADRRDRYGRLLAYLSAGDTDANRALLVAGYARVYETEFGRATAYREAAAAARANGTGVWRCRDPVAGAAGDGLVLVGIHADAAGDDGRNLEDEYVVFGNAGDETLDLSGWTVSDEVGNSYRFPEGTTVEPGGTVTLHTGAGRDTAAARYWGADGPVWGNDGDVVVVSDGDSEVLWVAYGG